MPQKLVCYQSYAGFGHVTLFNTYVTARWQRSHSLAIACTNQNDRFDLVIDIFVKSDPVYENENV